MVVANGHLVILGTTASGKSSLAFALAQLRPNVELVSMDSMALYRHMNIGTATPTAEEQAAVPHHLIDLAAPTEEFTVSQFQRAAQQAIADIETRGKRAVLVGGTGLHVRSVVDDLDIPGQFPETRAELETESDIEVLYQRLLTLDPLAAGRMEPSNRRRILRALEVTVGAGRPFSAFGPGIDAYPPTPFTQVGLRLSRELVDRRIAERYQKQLDEGFLDEVAEVMALEPSRTAKRALGYGQLAAHLDGLCTLEDAVAEAVRDTRRFARRQERWFRRDPRIEWLDVQESSQEVLEKVLLRFDELANH
ncbi:MAG: tRNA (adenosine(37)-N6)-dimethylallyltransferase MiaA [Acidimicrobiales bacterium]|jgi:tRNA dimethylallyltransferase|nr:tRNA (adenosine(37)-N6)-dimethylallyltransferase MiaA [Acidimicrobiia bacterium]